MKLADLASVLREQRELIGIPKAEIARRVEVSEGYILMVEQGKRRPSKAVLERWATALGRDAAFTRKLLALAGHIPQEQANGSLIELPLSADKLHFPQPRLFERERVIQEVQGLLSRAETSDEKWDDTLGLLRSYLQFLQFRLGEEPAPVIHTAVTHVSSQMQAVKGVIEAVGVGNVQAALKNFGDSTRFKLYQNWRGEDAEEWEDTVTWTEQKKGNLYLLMNGFPGITVSPKQYENQLKQIQYPEDWGANFIDSAMKHREARWIAFRSQVEGFEFCHIISEGALKWYLDKRFHSPNAWACLLKGTEAEYDHIAAHIRNVIDLLKIYRNYKIGLMEDRPEVDIKLYDNVHWEVKVGHAVLLENFMSGQEQGILIVEPRVVKEFERFYEELWNDRRYVNTDKEDVIRKLEEYAKKADELHHARALKTL